MIGGSLSARGSDMPAATPQTHSPTRFIEDLGAAFRASAAAARLDLFSIHPYPANSRIPPSFAHPHDCDRPGRLREARRPPRWRLRRHRPAGELRSRSSTASTASRRRSRPPRRACTPAPSSPPYEPIDEQQQADGYADAIRIAACSPPVRMLLFFHVTDEPQLERLQTGVFYADDTPKSSLRPVSDAAAKARDGDVDCN